MEGRLKKITTLTRVNQKKRFESQRVVENMETDEAQHGKARVIKSRLVLLLHLVGREVSTSSFKPIKERIRLSKRPAFVITD